MVKQVVVNQYRNKLRETSLGSHWELNPGPPTIAINALTNGLLDYRSYPACTLRPTVMGLSDATASENSACKFFVSVRLYRSPSGQREFQALTFDDNNHCAPPFMAGLSAQRSKRG